MERCIPQLPLSKLCSVPFSLQNRALFEGGKRAKRCREKGRKRGGQQRGQKGKKDARKQVRFRPISRCSSKLCFLVLPSKDRLLCSILFLFSYLKVCFFICLHCVQGPRPNNRNLSDDFFVRPFCTNTVSREFFVQKLGGITTEIPSVGIIQRNDKENQVAKS